MKKKDPRFALIPMFFWLMMPSILFSQGWDLVQKNDYPAAKISFREAVAKNPGDESASIGLMFLAELELDFFGRLDVFHKFSKAKMDEDLVKLFYVPGIGEALGMDGFSIQVDKTTPFYRLRLADSLYWAGEIEKGDALLAEVVVPMKWAILGPFPNIGGGGYLKDFGPEAEEYNPDKIFQKNSFETLKWKDNKFGDRDGSISLMNSFRSYGGSPDEVYYLNSFVGIPTEQTVQLRIGRSVPAKIWVDGSLVFSDDKQSKYKLDGEMISIPMAKGTHRVLVKLASLPDERAGGGLEIWEGLGMMFRGLGDFPKANVQSKVKKDNSKIVKRHWWACPGVSGQGGGSNFFMRITDEAGKVIQGVSSAYSGIYTHTSYKPTLKREELYQNFLNRIKDNPSEIHLYYPLCQAWLQDGNLQEAEEFFVKLHRKNPESVYFKYLTFLCYSVNGKSNLAEKLLGGVDQKKTPIVILLMKNFGDGMLGDRKPNMKDELKEIKEVAPSSAMVVIGMVSYFMEEEMKEECLKYIDSVITEFPYYKILLQPLVDHLKDGEVEKKPRDYSSDFTMYESGDSKKSKKKGHVFEYGYNRPMDLPESMQKELKYLSNETEMNSYYSFMHRNSGSNEEEKDKIEISEKTVIYLEENIKRVPENFNLRVMRIKALMNLGRIDEALKQLAEIFPFAETPESLLMLEVDLLLEKKDSVSAISRLRKIAETSKENYFYGQEDPIAERIKKLGGAESDFRKPNLPEFDSILKNNDWREKYKMENSVVLLFARDYDFTRSSHDKVYCRMLIGIVKADGARQWTEQDLRQLGDIKSCKVIKADGDIVTPDRELSYAVFKNLEPGDVIQVEGEERIRAKGPVNEEWVETSDYNFSAFSELIRINVTLPDSIPFHYFFNDKVAEPVISKTGKLKNYTWEIHQLPPHSTEQGLINEADGTSWFQFSTLENWSRVVDWYIDKTYQKLEPTYEVKEALDSIVNPGMTAVEKIEAIHNFIATDIHYSFVPFLQSGHVPKRPGVTCADGIGDCKDVATLMITMLREVGIPAWYTLVTTNNVNADAMPPCHWFNHAICAYELDGKINFADLTSDYFPWNVLSPADAGAWALVIRPGTNQLVQLPNDYLDHAESTQRIKVNATLDESGTLSLHADLDLHGILAGSLREWYTNMTPEERNNEFSRKFGMGRLPGIVTDSLKFEHLDSLMPVLVGSVDGHSSSYAEFLGEQLLINLPLLDRVTPHAIVTATTRTRDLDVRDLIFPELVIQDIKVNIPKGFEVLVFPKNVSLLSEFGKYELNFEKVEGGFTAHRELSLNQMIVPAEKFTAFRDFYNQMVTAEKYRISVGRK